MACEVLAGITGVERVWSLPGPEPGYAIASNLASAPPSGLRQIPSLPIKRVVLRDRWGKRLMGHALDNYRALELPRHGASRTSVVEPLDAGLQLVRVRRDEGVVCQMSDGSEHVCTGVIFADGARSRGRELMERPPRGRADAAGVACWSFLRSDPLDMQVWEFRTAMGKSVELLPLPAGKLRVKLRFRTSHGARQLPAELCDLFSEFGPDLAALLEGVDVSAISYCEEEDPLKVAFSPLPGTMALGQAALGVPLLESFDWALRLSRMQMERVVESLLADNWDPIAWEPAFQESLKPILDSERYLRKGLHYDNALLRPIRDVALRLIPAGILVDRVKGRLVGI